MAIDTLPMSEMFSTCYKILKRKLVPIHYATLTEMALAEQGLSKSDVHWERQIEDVREKMLQAGRYETFYTGRPLCLAGIRWWFENEQQRLFHPTDGITIPGNATSGADGAYEALMRDPYMQKKTSAPDDRIARTRANGLVLEKHVARWFKELWPRFYLPPDNEGQWKRFCDHDFKLKVDGKTYQVDVSGPRLNGQFGNPGQGKRKTDFHLICEITGQDVAWRSVYQGKDYQGVILPEGGIYPERMIVWLNCRQNQVDYEAVKNSVLENIRVAA